MCGIYQILGIQPFREIPLYRSENVDLTGGRFQICEKCHLGSAIKLIIIPNLSFYFIMNILKTIKFWALLGARLNQNSKSRASSPSASLGSFTLDGRRSLPLKSKPLERLR
jgi:hypothetical protein